MGFCGSQADAVAVLEEELGLASAVMLVTPITSIRGAMVFKPAEVGLKSGDCVHMRHIVIDLIHTWRAASCICRLLYLPPLLFAASFICRLFLYVV